MPFLLKSRLVNINYNDNRRTIYNQIFDYGKGDHTLFAMDNGLGKTVLIQFLIQPFVKNKRDLAGRSFDNYFKSGDVSYVMHELLIEEDKLLLVGMAIKKETKEDAPSKLKIITFIYEYSGPNQYDLEHLPLIENNRILKFSEAESLLKTISKNLSSFYYYNFNDYEKRKQYFELLENYNLNYKEWEDIIRKTNNDESGLSKLYDHNKDDEALIKNEIIPLIESKLATNDKKINIIKNNLKSYIKSYKKSREGVKRLKVYQSFKNDFSKILIKLKEGLIQKEEVHNLHLTLKNIFFSALKYQDVLKEEIDKCKLTKEDLLKEIKGINYESISLKYYEQQSEIEKIKKEISLKEKELNELESEVRNLKKNKAILLVLKERDYLESLENQLQAVLEGINNSKRTDDETKELIKNYTYSLKVLYKELLNKLKEEVRNLTEMLETNDSLIKKNKDELNNHNEKVQESNQQLTSINYQISEYHREKESFKEVSESGLSDYIDLINSKINEKQQELITLEKKSSDYLLKKKSIQKTIEELNRKLIEAQEERMHAVINYQDYQEQKDKIDLIFIEKGLEESEEIDALIKQINNEINLLEKEKQSLTNKKERNINAITHFQKGSVPIPPNIERNLGEKGIEFNYGLKYLQEKSNDEQLRLLNGNPFLPFSIILKADALDIIKDEGLDIYTDYPVPLVNLNKLEIDFSQKNQVINVGGQEFLLSFNNELLRTNRREKLIYEKEQENKRLEKAIKRLETSVINNYQHLQMLSAFKGYNESKLLSELEEKETTLQKLKEKVITYQKELEDLEENNLYQEMVEINIELQELRQKQKDASYLLTSYHNYLENIIILEREEAKHKSLLDERKELEENLEALRNKGKELELQILQTNTEIKQVEKEFLKYVGTEDGVLLDEDIRSLESKLMAINNKYDFHLSTLYFQKDDLVHRLEEKREELNEIITIENLKESDFLNKHYYEADYKAISKSIEQLEKMKISLNEKQTKLNISIEVSKRDLDYIIKDLNRLGFISPLPVENIGAINFQKRIEKLKCAITDIENSINEKTHEMHQLDLLLNSLSSAVDIKKDEPESSYSYFFDDLNKVEDELKVIKKSYQELVKEVVLIDDELIREVRSLYEKYRDQDYSLKEQVKLFTLKKSIINASNELEIFENYLDTTIRRLELSVSHIQEEETIIHNEVLRYCGEVLEELKSIDSKSILTINNKTQKMMVIELPSTVSEEAVKDYISKKVFEYSADDDFEKLLNFEISTEELMNKYLGGINHLKVIIKKIEKNRLIPKSWKETLSQNSGGEKFVSMFILLACFLSYMRKSKVGLGQVDDQKIIIMDNPFAKTNAEHLLLPMFDLASKYKIQLICFSGIGGSAVYNQFNRIYTAKALSAPNHKEQVEFTLEKAPKNDTLEFASFEFYDSIKKT
ncbi:MAG: hypothetical protein ACOX40_07915 [Bacilli bacterium]|jgi:hypothetical protein